MSRTFAFVANFNRGDSAAETRGICVYEFDNATGALTFRSEFAGIDNPGYLAIDQQRHRLYTAMEIPAWTENLAVAFDIDPATGALSYINMQPTHGNTTCHLGFDQTRQLLFASHWTVPDPARPPGAAFTAFQIRSDGGLEPPFATAVHSGPHAASPTLQDQHGHCAVASPDNRFVYVCDLGLDRVFAYRLPKPGEDLAPADVPFTQLAAGSGPRHLTFHPVYNVAYVINELNSTISVLRHDPANGELTQVQVLSTLPELFEGNNSCAEISVSRDGRFLYGSNRGHDSIVSYAIDDTGMIGLLGWNSSEGATPRNFAIDPSGNFMLVANQRGGGVTIFRRNADTGLIEFTGQRLSLARPMGIVFGAFH